MDRLKKNIVPITILILTLGAITLLINRTRESNDDQSLSIILILLTIALILISNYFVTKMLDKTVPWSIYKIRRFILQVTLGLIVSLGIINALYIVLKSNFTDTSPDTIQLIILNTYAAAIIIPCIAIYFGVKFLKAWSNSQLEAERLQKENARSQMMSLRNHLDPHFLFNNLNILSSLMDHDIELSKTYLEKFAEVYRTILKSELSDLTMLKQELKLIEAYIYLVKIRWNNALEINIQIDSEDINKALPPLSGQMLIENVIKHNTISKSSIIKIDIISDGQFLIIGNSKKPKLFEQKEVSGTGLINIQNRYAYFTDRKVEIKETEQRFEVKLPLLLIE